MPDGAASGAPCADCQTRPPAFDRVTAPLLYQRPIDDLIAGFKYHHRLAVGRALADLLIETLADRAGGPDLLLPVPADPARLRERGFNQAAEIARRLHHATGIPWSTRGLIRRGHSVAQRGLSRDRRRRNVQKDFLAGKGLPTRVALIDDVVTTGATVEAASRTLKRMGVEEVEVWAIARTPRDRWR